MNQFQHGLPPQSWDDDLKALDGHFLQSRVWAHFQEVLSRRVVWAQSQNWMWLATMRGQKGLKYLLCSYGPTAVDSESAMGAFESLLAAAKALGCDFIRIEPQPGLEPARMRQMGARRIAEVQPAHTQVVDLRQSQDQLRAEMASGHRNLINGTERRGISIRISTDGKDIDEFLEMLHETAHRAHASFYPDWYYRKLIEILVPGSAMLYVAEAESQPVAMALFYDWRGTRYYAHAAAHQQLNRRLKASVSLVWQALLDAKSAGMQRFDLWGVAPSEDPNHAYAGITKFKKAFGGQQIDYAGTWDVPLKPMKYQAYSLYRKLRGRG
jgi:hypothetical protein